MANVNDKPATLITGAGRGIGRAIARRLAEAGPVLLVGRTERDLVAASAEITADGGMAHYYVGDVADVAVAQAAVAAMHELGWWPARLVCNAGIGKSRPTHELRPQEWHEVLATNLDGSLNFIQAALPAMRRHGSGVICLMSSLAGVKGYAYEAAYTASKHALVGLAQSVALEYGKHGIACVPVCPGFVEGEMTTRTIRGLAARRGIDEAAAHDVIARLNPQQRIIPAAEVAELVAFVCSNKVPSLSGHPIVMSGGA